MFPSSIAESTEYKFITKIVTKYRKILYNRGIIISENEFNHAFGNYIEHRLYFFYVGYDNDTRQNQFSLWPANSETILAFLENYRNKYSTQLVQRKAKFMDLDMKEFVQTMFAELEEKLIRNEEPETSTDPWPNKTAKQLEVGKQQSSTNVPSQVIANTTTQIEALDLLEEEDMRIGQVTKTKVKKAGGTRSMKKPLIVDDSKKTVIDRVKTSIRKIVSKAKKRQPIDTNTEFNQGIEILDDQLPGSSSSNTRNATPSLETTNVISCLDDTSATQTRNLRSRKVASYCENTQNDINDSNDDEDYVDTTTPQNRKRKWKKNNVEPPAVERTRKWRQTNPDESTSVDRTRNWRQKSRQESDTDEDIDDIKNPDPQTAINLGLQDEECLYCGAMHFAGEFVCCSNGKIFIPPQRKLPPKLAHYLFDDYIGRSVFKNTILSYNNAFAMASMPYHHADVAPHGVQVVKPIGPVRHYTSCAIPSEYNDLLFGNFYVYQGLDALHFREKAFTTLNPEIMKDIQEVMDEYNALGKLYYAMGEITKKQGDEVSYVRMKIVDPRRVEKESLLSHPGTYRSAMTSGDHVALFYNATVEQQVKLPGLNIYGKRRPKMEPQPMFPTDPRIPGLCYPLLYPYGEIPWRRETELYLGEKIKMTYKERLLAWAEHHQDWANNWEITFNWQQLRSASKNREAAALNPENQPEDDETVEKENPIENDYEMQYAQIDAGNLPTDTEKIHFEERGGEVYPVIGNEADKQVVPHRQSDDPNHDDSNGNLLNAIITEYLPIGEANELTQQSENNVLSTENDENESNTSNKDNSEHLTDVEDEHGDDLENEPETNEENKRRKFASFKDYGLYIHQNRRKYYRNRFSSAGKVGQLQLTDMCARLFEQRYSYAAKHHTEFMTSNKNKFIKAMQRSANRIGRKIGCLTSMPHTIPGSPRFLQRQYEHAVAMCNTIGKPDIFITITCNVGWPEIKDNIPIGETWADHPFLVNSVFKKKSEKLMDVLFGKKNTAGVRQKGHFGRVRWYTYSIEFQQRGPPHMHSIVSLKRKIKTAAQVDKVCQATLPKNNDELREIVENFHIHRPCENDPEAYCRFACKPHWKSCDKGFPKEFNNTTQLGDRNYPLLRRPNDGEKCEKHGFVADNRHVVPYNATLLTMWRGHMNVEVISTLKVLKYIFKYVFKGYDRALVEALTSSSHADASQMTIEGHLMFPRDIKIHPGAKKQRQLLAKKMLKRANIPLKDAQGQPVLVLNEYWACQDMRAMTSCEAAWEFAGYPRCGSSHTVTDLFVHGENEEPIMFPPGEEEAMAERIAEEGVTSRFTSWMKLNAIDPEARKYNYPQIPEHYRFVKDSWIKKKHEFKNLFGRVRSVHPNNKEVFAIRLLSSVQKGPASYKELRTVAGEIHPTNVSAAKALGLMNDQQEWERALREAATEQMPSMLRRLFVWILSFNPVSDPLLLWNTFKSDFFEYNRYWTDEMKEAHALYHIETELKVHTKTLESCNLPSVNVANLPPSDYLEDDSGRPVTSVEKSRHRTMELVKGMNEDQLNAFKEISNGISNNDGKTYFIQGSGGTGKTLVMRALYHHLVAHGHIISCVAHTGIAAMLLPFGSTSHREFNIPLTVEDNMHSNIHLESHEAELLKRITVVFWDEATMTDRRIFTCVDRLMRQLHPENSALLFGGVTFVLGGDWKQTLPIVADVRGEGVVQYTLLGSDLWNQIKVLHLKINMRARSDPEFSKYIARVGDGSANLDENMRPEDQQVELPKNCLVDSEALLIRKMFGVFDKPENKKEVFASSTIMAVDNKTTFDVNAKVLKLIDSPLHEFLSIDEHDSNTGFTALDPEVYHAQTPSGKPPHKIQIKVGAVVILLRNINTFLGLANGTRLFITKIGKEVIYCSPLCPGPRTPKIIALHRFMFSPASTPNRETSFTRTQFPIRLAMCITCNRAQGQTLIKAGLILRTPCFTHGQLYVALTRVRASKDLSIYNAADNPLVTNNVVFRSAVV